MQTKYIKLDTFCMTMIYIIVKTYWESESKRKKQRKEKNKHSNEYLCGCTKFCQLEDNRVAGYLHTEFFFYEFDYYGNSARFGINHLEQHKNHYYSNRIYIPECVRVLVGVCSSTMCSCRCRCFVVADVTVTFSRKA